MLATEQQTKIIRGGRVGRFRGKVVSFAPAMLMASVSVMALSFGVAQAEVVSTPQTTPQSFLTNEDNTIAATITIEATGDVSAVSLPDGYSGTTVNNSTIKVIADDDGDIDGIYVDGDLLGSIINDGSIILDVDDASDYAYYGININGTVAAGALVENNGSILIDMESGGGPEATGINVDDEIGATGAVRNTGTITVKALNSDEGAVEASGIWAKANVAGLIENTDIISVTASAEGGVAARVDVYGLRVGDGFGGNLSATGVINNSGKITVAGKGEDTDVEAYGITVGGDLDGKIINTGTVTVSADVPDYYATAEGIYAFDVNGSITNSGTITAKAVALNDYALAYGIDVRTIEETGSITNSGTITAQADGGSSVSAYGIETTDVNGSITNSGTITAKAVSTGTGPDDFALAYGIEGSTLGETGSITNSGTITAQATAEASIYAAGITLSFVNGSIINSGTITAKAVSTDDTILVSGIDVGTLGETGSITNSGTITVQATARSFVTNASGIDAAFVNGSITNSATINVKAVSTDSSATAYGINSYAIGEAGRITNSGTITAQATAESTASAYGIEATVVNGSITNSGTITAKAASINGFAHAGGIKLLTTIDTSRMTNSGTVTAQATAETLASAHGISAFIVYGSVTNSGTITATAVSADSGATAFGLSTGLVFETGLVANSGTIVAEAQGKDLALAYGVYNGSFNFGAFNNTGTITAIGNSTGSMSHASAYGVFMSYVSEDGSFTNSGTIVAAAQGAADADARGVHVDLFNGALTNTGVIKASSNYEAYAIYLGYGDGTLNLFTNGTIEGLIRVGDHDVNMTSVANGSAYYEFEDANTSAGVFSTLVDGGLPWLVSGEGTDKPIYATVGTTGLSANPLELAGIVGLSGGFGSEFVNLFGGSDGVSVSRSGQNDLVQSSMAFGLPDQFTKFVRGRYDKVTYSDPGLEQKIGVGGLFAGGVGNMQNGLGFGVMGGVVSTSAKGANPGGATFDNESTGGMLEFGFAQKTQGAVFDLGVHVGALSHDNKRFISTGGGVESANSSFNSVFYGVSLGATTMPMAMANGLMVTPWARVSATQQRLGGYTETGATANATVGSRKATITEAKIGVEVAKQIESGRLSGSFEILSRHSSGDGAFDVSLFGATAAGNTASRSDSFGSIGLGYETKLSNGGNLDLAASANVVGSGIGGQAVSATLRFDF